MDDPNTARRLRMALEAGDDEGVRQIIDQHPTWVDLVWPDNKTPLKLAVDGQSLECVEMVLAAADTRNVALNDKNKALELTATLGSIAIVKRLVQHGAKTKYGGGRETPLMLATIAGQLDCVKWLLPLSDPDEGDHEGRTALMHAIVGTHRACAEVLIPASNLLRTSAQGAYALSLAAFSDRRAECLELLLSQRAFRDIGDRAPAMTAAINRKAWGCLDRLVAAGPVEEIAQVLNSLPTGVHLPRSFSILESMQLHSLVHPRSEPAKVQGERQSNTIESSRRVHRL